MTQSSKWQKNLTIGFCRTMGSNKTFQQKHGRRVMLGEPGESASCATLSKRALEIATELSATSAAGTR